MASHTQPPNPQDEPALSCRIVPVPCALYCPVAGQLPVGSSGRFKLRHKLQRHRISIEAMDTQRLRSVRELAKGIRANKRLTRSTWFPPPASNKSQGPAAFSPSARDASNAPVGGCIMARQGCEPARECKGKGASAPPPPLELDLFLRPTSQTAPPSPPPQQ